MSLRGHWVVVIAVAGTSGLVGLVIGLLLAPRGAPSGEVGITGCAPKVMIMPSPRYTVGDCVEHTPARERWEEPIIVRISAVGRAHYQVRYWGGSGWSTTVWTERFNDLEDKPLIQCPK